MPIADKADITFYYAPQTRSFRALWFLEELGRPYRLELVDYAKGGHKRPEFLKINPMGKVPVVVDQGMPIAETGAIFTHLADKYSPDELAPLIKDPRRADYLRWLFFAAGVMEPAFGEKFFKWEIPPQPRRLGQLRHHGEDGDRCRQRRLLADRRSIHRRGYLRRLEPPLRHDAEALSRERARSPTLWRAARRGRR